MSDRFPTVSEQLGIAIVLVCDRLPEESHPVLVAGGKAVYSDQAWISIEEKPHREIQWEVRWWAEIPNTLEPPTLQASPSELAEQLQIANEKRRVAGLAEALSDREPSGFARESCGKDFSEHLGLVGTCRQLTAAQQRVAELEAENARLLKRVNDLEQAIANGMNDATRFVDRNGWLESEHQRLKQENERLRGLLREAVDGCSSPGVWSSWQLPIAFQDRIKAELGSE